MDYKNSNINTAHMRGGNGCDYATTGTVTAGTGIKWYGFVVNEDAVIASATFVDSDGGALTYSPTWATKTLAAGTFIPFGVINSEDCFASAIVVTSGSVILYRN